MANNRASNAGLVNLEEVHQRIRSLEKTILWEETGDFTSPLTLRERQILNYMAQGCLNKQMAHILGISEHTIKNHVSSILAKLGAYRRTEAVVTAIKQGLLSVEEVGGN